MEIEITHTEREELINQPHKPGILFKGEFKDTALPTNKHCLLVHGWNSDSSAMGKIYQELKKAPESTNFTFWRVDYDWERAFPYGATEVLASIKENNIPLERTVIFCYSMGGVVMRKVLAAGLPFYALVSVCSPHEGMLLFKDEGSISLQFLSQDLKALNQNKNDIAARNRFHFFGISHSNPTGYHKTDNVVDLNSALGTNLHPKYSKEMLVKYAGLHNPIEPHQLGMEPKFIQPALAKARELMAQLK
jgi:hypothetical protein